MRKKSKYQVGGQNDLYSTDFFNQVASYLQANQQQPQQDEQESEDNNTEEAAETTSSDIGDDNYQELLGKYNDLASQLESLQRNQTIGKDFNDPFLNFIFQDDDNMPITFSDEEVSGTPASTPNTNVSRTPSAEGISFKQGVSSQGLSNQLTGVLSGIKSKIGNFTVTSGLRTPQENSKITGSAKNSFHLTGRAADIRTEPKTDAFFASPEGRAYMQSQGYEIIDERNVKGVGPHWHIEPAKRQMGGVASTPTELANGLNGSSLQSMTLDLPPQYNLIRGLDSGRPIKVTDQRGKTAVLHGPNHTVAMYGVVKEHKMQVGGYTKEQIAEANKQAKKFAVERNLIMGENATVGNRVPDYVDINGNKLSPDYSPIPKSLVSPYVPQQVNELFWDEKLNLPYYIDPSSGDIQYTQKQNFYSPRFKKNP